MRKMSPGIMSPIIFIFLFSYIISAPLVSSLCYTPGGKQQATLEYQACPYSNGVASMCCATNRTNPSGGNLSEAYTADNCLSNGLCQNVGEKTDDQGNTTTLVTYWREMCTISNWSVGGCLSVCTDSSEVDNSQNARMTPCTGKADSPTWCCGLSTACCNTTSAISVEALFAQTSPTSTSSSTSSTNSSSTSPSGNTASTSSSGLSSGAKAGIGVGCAVGGIAIIALFFWLFRRRRTSRSGAPGSYATAEPAYAVVPPPQELAPGGVHEKPVGLQDARYELSSEPAGGSRT